MLALLVATAAWVTRGLAAAWLALLCLAAAVALALGAAAGLDLHPWTDAPVAVFALTGGSLLGRLVPARARPMLALLAVLAAFDTIQLIAPSPASGPAAPTAHPGGAVLPGRSRATGGCSDPSSRTSARRPTG